MRTARNNWCRVSRGTKSRALGDSHAGLDGDNHTRFELAPVAYAILFLGERRFHRTFRHNEALTGWTSIGSFAHVQSVSTGDIVNLETDVMSEAVRKECDYGSGFLDFFETSVVKDPQFHEALNSYVFGKRNECVEFNTGLHTLNALSSAIKISFMPLDSHLSDQSRY